MGDMDRPFLFRFQVKYSSLEKREAIIFLSYSSTGNHSIYGLWPGVLSRECLPCTVEALQHRNAAGRATSPWKYRMSQLFTHWARGRVLLCWMSPLARLSQLGAAGNVWQQVRFSQLLPGCWASLESLCFPLVLWPHLSAPQSSLEPPPAPQTWPGSTLDFCCTAPRCPVSHPCPCTDSPAPAGPVQPVLLISGLWHPQSAPHQDVCVCSRKNRMCHAALSLAEISFLCSLVGCSAT